MNETTLRWARWAILLPLLAAGCASVRETSYFHPSADLGAIRRVAVLPFDTLTSEPAVAEKVQKIFQVELLALGVVEVVEPGDVAKLLAAERRNGPVELSSSELQRLGAALGVEGLFLGTVIDFGESVSGATRAPEVTIQLQLVEVASGVTAWSSSESRSGANARARLLGFGGDSLSQAARALIRDQLRTLTR